jgi:2-hydroxy-6-oxonona-2,4-dienedioate hydrolase
MVSTGQHTRESTSRLVQTEKWRIHINEAGSGFPLIMLHGSGPGATGWSNFNQNLGPLSQKYRVILVDFPGWGESDEVDPAVEPRNNPLAVKLLMDALGIEKAALIGNSMGGGAVLNFAVEYPDRISHIITMGSGVPGANIFTPGGQTEGIRILFETYRNPTPENFRALVRVMVYDDSFVTDELCRQRSASALANPRHLENYLKPNGAVPPPPDLLARLAQVETPALIIHGRDDRTVPLEGSMRLVSSIPDSRLVVFNRYGHWAQLEHARDFNWLVDQFVASH